MVSQLIQTFDERRDIAIPGDREKTVEFCIEHFIKSANDAIADHNYFAVALSGGSTPKAIFQGLSKPENQKRIDWDKVLVFWSDERCVPADHPDSNYKMAMDAGLGTLGIPKEHIFRMRGEQQPEDAAKEYDLLIMEELPHERFDLVMLGMGDDGHTASLFPKTHALHAIGHMITFNYVPQKDAWRLTMTYDCINDASNIAIYVLGANKADVLAKVFTSPLDYDTYPIQNVGTGTHKALWIVDQDAAAKLKEES